MISKTFVSVGAAALLVVAGAVTFEVEQPANRAVPRHEQPTSAITTTKPSVKVALPPSQPQSVPPSQQQDAGSSGEPSYFTPPTTGAGTGDPALPVGNYFEFLPVNPGYQELLEYFLNVTQSSSTGTFSGTLYFRYQDGRTDTVFPFSGVISPNATSATITVTGPPTVVSYNGTVTYVQATVNSGQQLRATLANKVVTLPGCTNYLHWLTPSGGLSTSLLSSDPYECNFYYLGAEHYPNRSQTPVGGEDPGSLIN